MKGDSEPMRVFLRLCTTVVSLVLIACGAVPFAAANTPAPRWDSDSMARFRPDPTGDPYLDRHFATTAAMADGTVLDSRQIAVLPPLALTSAFTAWQAWFKTSAADGSPIAALTTVLKPDAWNGRIVSNNFAIDGLGRTCNPSYQLTNSVSIEEPDVTRQLLERGYAVVLTDYEGPLMAYGHGPTEGREVLDGIRAALRLPEAGLSGPIALLGYSGGAIATVWAAQLAPEYAPELDLVGAAAGGTPTDLSLLPATMDGRPPGSAFYLLGALGVARATPGALNLLNPLGAELAERFRNACVYTGLAFAGVPLPVQALTEGNPYDTEVVRQMFRDTRPGAQVPRAPIYFWHGSDDEFIPLRGVEELAREWSSRGAETTLDVLPCGGHVACAFAPNGIQAVDRWMASAQ
ncbi:hypothetical protein AWN90_38755 [Nocardia terpenica]|uniref:Lipase n=3 Tax=Nocardia terpenica TaxID=455432 RepID=A0A164JM16_9NOCA|nr:hypothetical protein AWN90_38755 [Nocardia terpenica]